MDYIVDGYFPNVESIEDDVLDMEQRALASFLSREEVMRLFTLRRQLIRFQRLLGPTLELVRKLLHTDMPCIDHDVRPYLNDVLDHVRRVESNVAGLRDVVTSVFEISSLLEQQRQSDITRKLAAWAAILAVPTAIAGIYGMNFKHMPELETQYGYFIVWLVIVTLCATLYARFRRAKWL
jgi:magnesium transporter